MLGRPEPGDITDLSHQSRPMDPAHPCELLDCPISPVVFEPAMDAIINQPDLPVIDIDQVS